MLEPDKDKPTGANLLAIIPSASLVMHRTKTTLGLLRDVVQESSANYWYEKGKRAIKVEEWDEAQAMLERSLILNALHWRAHLQLALVGCNSKLRGSSSSRKIGPVSDALSDA